jgi:hypothetical protein
MLISIIFGHGGFFADDNYNLFKVDLIIRFKLLRRNCHDGRRNGIHTSRLRNFCADNNMNHPNGFSFDGTMTDGVQIPYYSFACKFGAFIIQKT